MSDKKLGRRIAGTYGRLGTKKLKRAASKGTRKASNDLAEELVDMLRPDRLIDPNDWRRAPKKEGEKDWLDSEEAQNICIEIAKTTKGRK